MWVIALFDLPSVSEEQDRDYARFRKGFLNDGFSMMQYLVYQGHCASTENAHAYMEWMGAVLPPEGEFRLLTITDKQLEKSVAFWEEKRAGGEIARPTPVFRNGVGVFFLGF